MVSHPGVPYFLGNLPMILAPPVVAHVCILALERVWEVVLPRWLNTTSYILAYPMFLGVYVFARDLTVFIKARRHGAVIAPRNRDGSPGNVLSLYRALQGMKVGYIGDGLDDLFKRLGNTLNLRVLFQDRVFTTEPDHIKIVLATQFDKFEKGETTRETLRDLLGTGVFASDGDMWKWHRSMTRPFFTRDRVTHFDIFDRHAEQAIRQMKARFKEGHPLDFQDLVSRFTLDSATEFLFGKDIHSLDATLPYPHYLGIARSTHGSDRFAQAFNSAQIATASRIRWGSHWPLVELWTNSTTMHTKAVKEMLDPILQEAISKKKAKGDTLLDVKAHREVQDDETILDHLVNYTDNPVILKDEIMNLAVAGRDTTASTLTFSAYMLAEHPHVFHKLQAEVLAIVGLSRRPTFDDFREMKYMKAFINEVLRLYAPVPFNLRAASEDVILPSQIPGQKPFFVPAGTRVAYSVLMMHRRKDLWGPTALDFDPERFLDGRLHTYLTPNPFIFLPFNAGPRICLGQQFAYNETSFFLTRLLQSFSSINLALDAQPPGSLPPMDWKDAPGRKGKEKVMMKSHLTLYVQDGLWINMTEAF